MEPNKLVKAIGKNWEILDCLYPDKSLNVSQIATSAQKDKPAVSRALVELERQEPSLVTKKEDGSGGNMKFVQLTEEGKHYVGAIRAVNEEISQPEIQVFPQLQEKRITFLIHQATKSSTDASSAASMRLDKLSKHANIWKFKSFRNYVDQLLRSDEPHDFQKGLDYLKKVLVRADRKTSKENDLVLEIGKKYLELLKNNLRRFEPPWFTTRNEIMDVLGILLEQKELRELFWGFWEELVNKISDSDDYEEHMKPYALFFTKQDYEFKESAEERLFELMNSTEPDVRKRAGSLHYMLFS